MKKARKWKGPRWSDYRAYLLATMTTDRDAWAMVEAGGPPGYLSGPVLRAHLVDNPLWGLRAQVERDPGLKKRLRSVLRIPHGWDIEVVLMDVTLMCQCLQAKGHAPNQWRDFIDLWGPRGVLEIRDEAWRDDPEFQTWLRKKEA